MLLKFTNSLTEVWFFGKDPILNVTLTTFKVVGRQKALLTTSGFVQLGHDVAAIIGSAYPRFIFGGRNSVGL